APVGTLKMSRPALADRPRLKQPLLREALAVEEMLRPVAERTSDPVGERHAEAHFGAFYQGGGDAPVEDLAQRPFGQTFAQLHAPRQRPAFLDNPMVQQRDA